MNDLGTSHRNGLSTYKEEELKERANVYGRNEQPLGQSLLKKSILNERDFMMNLLFYLLTLRVCIKLLLLRDIAMGLDPLHG
jgi:histone deacetylase complex regulatory component SIN3